MQRLVQGVKIPFLLFSIGLFTFALASGWVEPSSGDLAPARSKATDALALQGAPTAQVFPGQKTPQPVPTDLRSPVDRRGVYLTANVAGNSKQLEEILQRSVEAGFNAV